MNVILSPLILVHVVIIAIAFIFRLLRIPFPKIPLAGKQYLAVPLFVATVFILTYSTGTIVATAWTMGTTQREYMYEVASNIVDSTAFAAESSEPEASVTYTFDDGWKSQYDNALPLLQKHNQKATFYIITHFMFEATESRNWFARMYTKIVEYFFPKDTFVRDNYMNVDQVKALQTAGEDVAAHTQTHPSLTHIPIEKAKQEIEGSKKDLASIGINATTLAYPEGDYSSTTEQIVKDAGFIGARSVDRGYTDSETPSYELLIQQVDNTTTIDDVEVWVQEAKKDKKNLILMFHQVDEEHSEYGVTPNFLETIMLYVKESGVKVQTMDELMKQLDK